MERRRAFAWEQWVMGGVGEGLRGRGFGRSLGGHRWRGENYGNGLSVDNRSARST